MQGGVRGVRGAAGAGLPFSAPPPPPPYQEPLPAGSNRLAGPEGARVVLAPWVTFPRADTWGWVLPPDSGWRDPAPSPGRAGASAGGPGLGCRALPGRPRGRSLAGRSCSSAPFRGPSRPLAGRANLRGPMTTRPDPSRPGPRATAEREPEVASLLSPAPQQRELLGSAETLAHLGFPQRTPPPGRHPTATGACIWIWLRDTWYWKAQGPGPSRSWAPSIRGTWEPESRPRSRSAVPKERLVALRIPEAPRPCTFQTARVLRPVDPRMSQAPVIQRTLGS